jgi:putative transposase
MKYAWMKQYQDEFSVERMSHVFEVSRSGYYRFVQHTCSKRTEENKRLLQEIKTVHEVSRGTYGSPRIHAALKAKGENCSRKRVARLMQQAEIQAKMVKRFKVTTQVDKQAPIARNLLGQNFTACAPNQRWVADISFIDTAEGWLYIAAVLDLFSRRVIGLAMQKRMTTHLVIAAMQQALSHRKPAAGLLHHSDKGTQYSSHDFQALLRLHGIYASMSGTGNCYDNAAMESFFHSLKTEHVYFEHYETREQAKQSIFEYVEVFYNRQRLHSTLGYLSPLAFEKQWYQQQGVSLLTVH